MLANYHRQVLQEMYTREWTPDAKWLIPGYRGRTLPKLPPNECSWDSLGKPIPEHTDAFLRRCREDLHHLVIETPGNWSQKDLDRVAALGL